jgi:hypothetical protein
MGAENGKASIGQSAIFFIVTIAALLDSAGRIWQRRLSGRGPP